MTDRPRVPALDKATLPLGLLLIAVAWTASWSGRTLLAHHAFFPLWLGYVLTVDGLVHRRTGSSPLVRSPRAFGLLFLCSIPFWWIFELLNARLHNWSYHLPHHYTWLAYHAEASLAFSTVVPAIVETGSLADTLLPRSIGERWPRLAPGRRGWQSFIAAGLVMLALVLIWPRAFFPLAWISLFFIVDPVVHLTGGASIATQIERGRWRPVISLFLAGITCGFFWEMWNSRALPKWSYDVPYANGPHLFEMPLLGYGGYFPFALETYALLKLADLLIHALPPGYLAFERTSEPHMPQSRL